MYYSMIDLLRKAVQDNASDIHICAGNPVKYRRNGVLERMTPEIYEAGDCEALITELVGEEELARCKRVGESDTSMTAGGTRIRVNVFKQQGNISAAVRLLREKIPQMDTLRLPEQAKTFAGLRRGLVLITGVTGSGKTTTVCSLLNEINHTRPCHIVTLEDPIEYVFRADKGVVSQREVGSDTESFASGLRAVLREDPDVIFIGEMRDPETMLSAVEAAETGHLVFATLHTRSAAETVDRIIEVFPEKQQAQIRLQLAAALHAVLSQQLLPDMKSESRILAAELMLMNTALRTLIRDGKTHQIDNAIMTSAREGCISMDGSLLQLYQEGRISRANCIAAAYDPDLMKRTIMKG